MTNKEIEKYKKELCAIQKIAAGKEKWERLKVLAEKLNAPIPSGLHDVYTLDSINKITPNIHNSLQTEIMFNACVSAEESSSFAKWACISAAIAAFISLLGVIASWIMIFKK